MLLSDKKGGATKCSSSKCSVSSMRLGFVHTENEALHILVVPLRTFLNPAGDPARISSGMTPTPLEGAGCYTP